jgi:hypothetical protein
VNDLDQLTAQASHEIELLTRIAHLMKIAVYLLSAILGVTFGSQVGPVIAQLVTR